MEVSCIGNDYVSRANPRSLITPQKQPARSIKFPLFVFLLCDHTKVISNNQSNHSMWCNSDIVRSKSTIKPQQSFLSSNFESAINTTLVGKCSIGQFRLSLQSR